MVNLSLPEPSIYYTCILSVQVASYLMSACRTFSSTGIRSLNFLDDVLTIGTGNGYVHFYDIRAGRLLELGCGHPCSLAVGNGWLVSAALQRIG